MEPSWVSHNSHCANGQVLIEVICSGICGSQLLEIGGHKGNKDFLPHLLGHEGCGRVKAVGAGVSVQMIGRKVCLHWRKGSGPEATLPARYDIGQQRTVGGGHVTTLATHAVVSANRVTVVDEDVPDELCALLGCGLSTALGTVEQEAKLRFGESVLVVGCGGVGLNLIQASRLACAYPIFATDIHANKNDVVRKLGAHSFTVFGQDDILRSMSDYDIGMKGFDVIMDTTGSVDALERVLPLLSDSGRLIMIGQPKPGETFRMTNALHMFHGEMGKRIIATQGGGFRPSTDIARYTNLWRAGHLDLENIVSHRMSLADVNRGIDLVRAGQAGRVMIFP